MTGEGGFLPELIKNMLERETPAQFAASADVEMAKEILKTLSYHFGRSESVCTVSTQICDSAGTITPKRAPAPAAACRLDPHSHKDHG